MPLNWLKFVRSLSLKYLFRQKVFFFPVKLLFQNPTICCIPPLPVCSTSCNAYRSNSLLSLSSSLLHVTSSLQSSSSSCPTFLPCGTPLFHLRRGLLSTWQPVPQTTAFQSQLRINSSTVTALYIYLRGKTTTVDIFQRSRSAEAYMQFKKFTNT